MSNEKETSVGGSAATHCSTAATVQLRSMGVFNQWKTVYVSGQLVHSLTAKRIVGQGWQLLDRGRVIGERLTQTGLKDLIRFRVTGQ
jgi:hypothetical protein